MKFQTKLSIVYMTIALLLVSAISGGFYWKASDEFEKNAYSSIVYTSTKMAQQLDSLIQYMDYTFENLITNGAFLDALSVSASLEKNAENAKYVLEADNVIMDTLYRDSLNKYFYRVNYFNHNNDFFSSKYYKRDTVSDNIEEVIQSITWLKNVDELHGTRYISQPHNDQWLKSGEEMVFSTAMAVNIYGINAGYLEIQSEYSLLDETLSVSSSEGIHVIALTPDKKVLYHNFDNEKQTEPYLLYKNYDNGKIINLTNKETGDDETITIVRGSYSDITVILVQNRSLLLAPFSETAVMIVYLSIIALIIAIALIYLWTIRLTKPIRSLRREIRKIELSDLKTLGTININKSTSPDTKDDILALNDAFYKLCHRLSKSIDNEMKAYEMQLQARFDSMQVQLDPHFIYNVLNVLSSKGIEVGSKEISKICKSIASMLRYSTSTKSKTATISEELEHINHYLSLIKIRFEDRFQYDIDVDDAVLNVVIPKIILQPLVENSQRHGYKNIKKDMNIFIKGYIEEGEDSNRYWCIQIMDDGDGFSEESLKELEKSMRIVKDQITSKTVDLNFSIGGMGIINTFARLNLLYKGNIQFVLGNRENGGASLLIKGVMQSV